MEYSNESLKVILDLDSNSKLVLPDFQRDFVWKREKQAELLASMLVELPIGSILIVNGDKDDFPARQLGSTEITQPSDECLFLLDGQQRLSCLKSVFDDLFPSPDNWKVAWDKLYGLLRNRWFLRIYSTNSDSEDIWGWETLKYLKNLHTLDPDQVEDFIVFYQILVKDQNNLNAWYHPAYKVIDQRGEEVTGIAQRRQRLADKFAQEGLVPLFEVYSKRGQADSLHNLALRKIANKQRDELKSKFADGEFSIEDILGHLNLDAVNISDESELEPLWFELASNWASDIRLEIEKLLDQVVMETILPSAEIGRAASIFETINEGGTRLSNFDLIVAKTSRSGISSLSKVFKDFIAKQVDIPTSCSTSLTTWKLVDMEAIKDNSIVRTVTDQFLNLVSILSYESELKDGIEDIKVEHIKQSRILRLKPDQISDQYERAIESLVKAFAFLQLRCGIIRISDVSYKLMILPIAYAFSKEDSGDVSSSVWDSVSKINKIEYWYWSSLFSGRFREKQNERCIEDLKSLYRWISGEITNPFEGYTVDIFNRPEYSDEKTLLMENDFAPPSAIKYGILQYILTQEPRDFQLQSSGAQIPRIKAWDIARNEKKIEEHHVIPLASATSIGESTATIRNDSRSLLNSPFNMTYISKDANREISDLSPSVYLTRLTSATMTGHHISQSMVNLLQQPSTSFDETFYRSVLQERFNTISQAIKTELEDLVDDR